MLEESSNAGEKRLSRKQFLLALGTVGATGLYLGVRLATPAVRLRAAEWLENSGGPPSSIEGPPDAWFEISPDNQVTLYLPKSEMGQGIHTALGQIAAEELEIAWEQLNVTHARTGRGIDDPVGTSASNSVSSLYLPLREAAATLRELLREEAARQLSAPASEIDLQDGVFWLRGDPDQQLSYGQLIEHAAQWELPEEPPALKAESAFQIIGESMPRLDLPDKVTGGAVFGFDVSLPDMLYGAVARPGTIGGQLLRAQPGQAPDQPGVANVLIEDGFAGVVAESRREAYQALEHLDLAWDPGRPWQQEDIEERIRVGQGMGATIQKEGNANALLDTRAPLEAEYRTPMAYHAYLEPLAAVADVREDWVEIWASTQSALRLRTAIATALDRDEETIIVNPVFLGGAFGRKIDETVAVEAARLSRAAGRPVQVGLNRREDFRNGFLRPPTHHRLRAVMSGDGLIEAIEHLQASGEVALPFVPELFGTILGSDFAAWRGAMIHYGIPNRETTAWVNKLPHPTGWWRGLGLLPNSFAVESFMDELAAEAGADPLEYRLRHLPDNDHGLRMRKVLKGAADAAGWGEALPPGRGRGLACISDVGTLVAEVAEVSIQEGVIRVERFTAAVDPGLIINPDGVKAQTEGAITMGLSAALIEEATIRDGVLEAANFDRYPLLRSSEAPEIDVVLLESSKTPRGVGEPPIGPVAAAVANAVFAAGGGRLRTLPLKLG